MSRIKNSVVNAKVVLGFNLALMILQFFSRRVWFDVLGKDLIGLSEVIRDYIGMLNLADMGISSAIAVVLYAPLFRSDKEQITEIVSIYGFLFRWVGIVVGVAGVIFSLFLPLLFGKDVIGMPLVYVTFYAFLLTTVLSYVVNYKQNLLVANQKNYIVVAVLNSCTIVKILVQITLLKWFGFGYISWLVMEVVTAVVFAIILEYRVNREYPWLRANISEGRSFLKKYPEITRNIRQMFVHKFTSFVTQQSQRIIVQNLMLLSDVAFLGNYKMISDNLVKLIVGPLTSNTGGVGHLLAEGDKPKIRLVFAQMNAMFYWIGGIVAFGFYLFITPLVRLWLPTADTFADWVVLIMAFNLFVYIVRQPVGYFVNAYGIFSDTPAAWTEAGLNILFSIILGIQYGIGGVVAGGAISSLLIVMIWKPHYLYYKGFGERSGVAYWITSVKYMVILAGVWVSVLYFYRQIYPVGAGSWLQLFVGAAVITVIVAILYGALLWITSRGMRDFTKLLYNVVTNKVMKEK